MYHHEEDHDLRSIQRPTDVPCCIGFIVALCIFGGMYIKVVAQGELGKLYHGIDYNGNVCGVDPDVVGEPYLYWCMKSGVGGVPKVSLKHPICVAACPGSVTQSTVSQSSSSQVYGIQPDCAAVAGAGSMASYKTKILMNRYCIPDPAAYPQLSEQVSGNNLADIEAFTAETFSSICAAWPVLLGSFFVAVMLGYLFLVLLRHCAGPMLYGTMLAAIIGFSLMGIYLLANAGTLSEKLRTQLNSDTDLPPEITDNEENLTRGVAGLCFVLSFITLCLACCFHQSIEVGSACVEVACETIFEMPSLLLLPVLKAFFKGALSLVLLIGFVELYSASPVVPGSDTEEPHLTHTKEQYLEMLFYMLMSFWILCFVNALYQFIVAYGVCEYYKTPYDHDQEKDVGCCALWDGLFFGLLYHGGSLALGSLLIAVLMVIQQVIRYAQKKEKEAGGNTLVDCVLCCCLCAVGCCKEIVEFIDKNAYIDIALTSNNFCDAAKDALQVITEIGGAMAILNGATFVFATFGTIMITLGCGAFTYVVASSGTFSEQSSQFEVANPIGPMLVSCAIGLLVALSFMHVFDMTSDTLLYCYGYDLKTGQGTQTAPTALKELVHGASDHH